LISAFLAEGTFASSFLGDSLRAEGAFFSTTAAFLVDAFLVDLGLISWL
jgi:hypothetical protein